MGDPISLGLAIAPLCITAIKAFSKLRLKLNIFRHHYKEIKQIQRKLRIQGDWFRDELHLLLLKVLDRGVVARMIEDENHSMWQKTDLEEKLRSYLGTKYDSFQNIIDEAREIIESLLDKLSAFSPPETAVPLSKSTRSAFRIAFKKQTYSNSIETLKEHNYELRRLRKTVAEIEKYPTVDQCSLPAGYAAIQAMSSPLYGLLRNQTSCNASIESNHIIMLLLNPTDETDANINIFFGHVFNAQRFLVPIHVRYKHLGYRNPDLESMQIAKRRRICEAHHDRYCVAIQPITSDPTECDGGDLTLTRIKCGSLSKSPCISRLGLPMCPLGYVDIKNGQRLVLYQGIQGFRADWKELNSRKTFNLIDLLRFPVYDITSDIDRLQLAITLVKSMLKYHSTPWWPLGWPLSNIHVFRQDNDDTPFCLDTLHIPVEFKIEASTVPRTGSATIPSTGERQQLDATVKCAMEDHGIRNLTLYGLGVALLQIGLWENVAWGDHIQVRRKVSRLSFLGRRYRNAAKRLIDCDFGLATEELGDRKLQSAIFNAVVGDLESLLHELTLSGV
ncbi:hypothetical protein F5Y04DRAFT_292205 [Hypomontagnella monticulosa]|nr:hypothetical protein F5Y04DRAFT_292205 [Hypomontagnella monticulosa]